jgi:hypothetical protein
MRHFLRSPSAIVALALGMQNPAAAASLIAPTGGMQGLAAGGFRTPAPAVDVAPVAVATDHHLAVATGAVEYPRTRALHRLLRPMRAGFKPDREGYCSAGRASHGGGRGTGWTVQVRAGVALVSTAPMI